MPYLSELLQLQACFAHHLIQLSDFCSWYSLVRIPEKKCLFFFSLIFRNMFIRHRPHVCNKISNCWKQLLLVLFSLGNLFVSHFHKKFFFFPPFKDIAAEYTYKQYVYNMSHGRALAYWNNIQHRKGKLHREMTC